LKNPKTLAIVIGTLVLLGVGFLFVRGPKPIIEIKAETITEIGPFPIVNTWVSAVLAVIVLAILAKLATRNISLVPGRMQNLVESVMEAMYNICVQAAGEKNGRRFFPVVMTILIFIWVANWMALLPFFNAIGTIEKVDAEEFHATAVVFSKSAGINLIKPNQKALEFDKAEIAAACRSYDTLPAGATAEQTATFDEKHTSCIDGQRGKAIATKLDSKEGTTSGVAACSGAAGDHEYDECLVHASETAIEQINADGKQLGVLIPYFRSMNTDINSPLSIAIMSMIFVEFWGITALGGFKYASKFFNVSSPIAFFVGILEFIAEIARIISFTFRLFGNMLAGEILLLVMTFLVPFVVAVPFYGLETFVGFIQAFVFAMLTLVFGVLAVSSLDDHEDHGIEEPGPVHIENVPAGVEPAH
jgi:F-type H+-transporting ATPase subunit a